MRGGRYAAVKDMRKKGHKLLAIWHSHPETPPRLSDEDLKLAYTPDVVYLIVSLCATEQPPCRGYIIENNRPVEVSIQVKATVK
ncbi:MAG: Mov34/MPN/PAD-1 family protein [Verrucomicrobiota bacterium]